MSALTITGDASRPNVRKRCLEHGATTVRVVVTALATALAAGPAPATAADEALALVRAMPTRYAAVRDYTAVLLMQERVRGDLLPVETIALEFARPFRVHMRWLDGPGTGRRLLYPAGQDDDRLLVREGGLLGLFALRLDPEGSWAMRWRRHPVTEVGIGAAIAEVLDFVDRTPSVEDLGRATVAGRPVRRIGLTSPDPAEDWQRARLEIDEDLGLPTVIERVDGNGALLERYRYSELRVNVGLGPRDFDPDAL